MNRPDRPVASMLAIGILASMLGGACRGEAGPRTDPSVEGNQQDGNRAPLTAVSIHPACAGVWQDVIADRSSVPNIPEASRRENDQIPDRDVIDRFFSKLAALEGALAPMGRLDRDLFYMRVHTSGFRRLTLLYPQIDPSLLRVAKIEACKDVLDGDHGDK